MSTLLTPRYAHSLGLLRSSSVAANSFLIFSGVMLSCIPYHHHGWRGYSQAMQMNGILEALLNWATYDVDQPCTSEGHATINASF